MTKRYQREFLYPAEHENLAAVVASSDGTNVSLSFTDGSDTIYFSAWEDTNHKMLLAEAKAASIMRDAFSTYYNAVSQLLLDKLDVDDENGDETEEEVLGV